jgi:TRAP-type C4-dicarboxylate transport system substrate-binding protein
VAAALPASAQQHVLRLATAAPAGTAFARETAAFAREIESETKGGVKIKWIYGGIAGDELQVGDRMARGQLDGIGSGGMLCEKGSHSFRVLHAMGLYRSPDEVEHVAARLRPAFEQEMRAHGLVYLGDVALGPTNLFLRNHVASFDALKREKLWAWDADQTNVQTLRALGLQVVPLPLETAGAAYDRSEHDGFVSIPSGALAFQWLHRVHFSADVRISYLMGCMLITQRSFDALAKDQQDVLRTAVARMRIRLRDVVQQQDEALIGSQLKRQGVVALEATRAIKDAFFQQATQARKKLGDWIPTATLQKAEELIAARRGRTP